MIFLFASSFIVKKVKEGSERQRNEKKANRFRKLSSWMCNLSHRYKKQSIVGGYVQCTELIPQKPEGFHFSSWLWKDDHHDSFLQNAKRNLGRRIVPCTTNSFRMKRWKSSLILHHLSCVSSERAGGRKYPVFGASASWIWPSRWINWFCSRVPFPVR